VEVVPISTPGLGDLSYLLCHRGLGILVDVQRDVGRFLDVLESRGVEPRYVLETHVHNDYVSGGKTLAEISGAELVMPAGSGVAYPHRPAFHREPIPFAGLEIVPIHTPGHTPEHTSYLVVEDGRPLAVFSGGSLLVGAAGRTDLLGERRARQLARMQWASIRRLAELDDTVALYPTHGAGSFCTATVAGPSTSAIGTEKETNPALSFSDPEAFADDQLSRLDPFPAYYAHMGPINLFGPPPPPDTPVPRLEPEQLERSGAVVVDGRPKEAFAEAHIPGSWGIEANQDFATWVGWLVPFDSPLVLVLDDEDTVGEARAALSRVGFDRVVGWMQGMDAWIDSGRPVASHGTITARGFLELDEDGPQVLDVRAPSEWRDGHLPGSVHRYLPDLVAAIPEGLDPAEPVYVGCTTGHRASTAAGMLGDRGYRPVVMVGASLLGVLMLTAQS
jgi:glyoxylase-like metal-dependent hydrolase (beta-lactamase superfamily II)/rhodanese-related sulfurtransferase